MIKYTFYIFLLFQYVFLSYLLSELFSCNSNSFSFFFPMLATYGLFRANFSYKLVQN